MTEDLDGDFVPLAHLSSDLTDYLPVGVSEVEIPVVQAFDFASDPKENSLSGGDASSLEIPLFDGFLDGSAASVTNDSGIATSSSSQGNSTAQDNSSFEDTFEPATENTSTSRKRTRQYLAPEKLTRKRQTNPDKWRRNIAKEKCNLGEEYVNPKGNVMKAHSLKPPCDESCRLKCYTKVNENDRKLLFHQFWKKIPTKQGKWLFLNNLINQFDKKSNLDANSRRNMTREYYLPVSSAPRAKVCKTMFLSTFDICDGWVKTSKSKKGSPDKRGSNIKGVKSLNPLLKQSVRDHICALPRMPRYYSRQDSTKEYLEEEIQSVSQMHRLYLEWMTENQPEKPVATLRHYIDVFNNEFNITFFVSKKDLCDTCVEYDNSPPEGKVILQEQYEKHIKNKEVSQTMRLADAHVAKLKVSKELAVLNFDYEKTLICPKARASIFYYHRKLSVNNFTIVDVGRNEDTCYVYDESVAAKGGNEVASFLLHLIERKVAEGIKEFRMYSDNCTGQNKNRQVASMYLLAAAKYDIKIVHRFLERGHTYNSADNVHSIIEKKVKPHDIFVPDQYYEKMRTAKRSEKNPIIVIEVNQDIVLNFKDLAGKLQLSKDTNGVQINWLQIREFSVLGSEPHILKVRFDLNGIQTSLCTKNVGRPVNFKSIEVPKAYNAPLPISKAKLEDLKVYCNRNFIPPEYQEFYHRLSDEMDAGGSNEAELDVPDSPRNEADVTVRGRPRKRRAKRTGKNKKNKKRATKNNRTPGELSEEDEDADED